MKTGVWISGFLFLCVACVDLDDQDSARRQDLIDTGVEIRIQEFRAQQWQKCREQAMDKAVARVDSIMRASARQESVEPIIKPPKPEKPDKPPVKTLPDTSVRQ